MPALASVRRTSGAKVAAAVLVPLVVVTAGLGASSVGATGSSKLVTPILSVRRLPDWIETTAADAKLVAGLPAIMKKLGPAAVSSCLVVRRDGQTIFADRPDAEEIPASNMKLLTATAVLDKFGPDARIRTSVVAARRPVGGVLHGNLYLVGGGDPLLRTTGYEADLDLPRPVFTSLPQLAGMVKAAGIRTIDGQVVGDGRLFDADRTVATWNPDYAADDNVGPLSALDVNDGFSPTKPFGAPSNPAATAAHVFSMLLHQEGIKVAGANGAAGVAPARVVPVTSILSPPIGAEVGEILRVSDDTGAELLAKLLGARFGQGGSTAAGVAVIRRQLAADGLPVGQLHQLDGSGLDRGDRASCNLIADDLDFEGTSGALYAGLPIAAETGTLATSMNGTAAAGRVHAKTGTLDGVSALSGFVMPKAGARAPTPQLLTRLTFSFISNNDSSIYLGEQVSDAIAVELAGPSPTVPPLADAQPQPDAVGPG